VLNGRKNEITLFKAIKELNGRSNYKLIIIGKGPERDHDNKEIHSLGISDKVIFIEYVPYNEIRYYYYLSDVFVLPSFYEGLPKVILEAMTYGKPIIASNIPGNNELVKDGENGYLHEPTDHKKLSMLLNMVLNDDELAKRFGENSRRKAEKVYTWDFISDNYFKAYKSVLKGGSSPLE
jgi:glycosyltransferase involved in cell wall biosynthesis